MKPVLLFDGQCAFCRRWSARLTRVSGDRLDLLSFHEPGVLERYGVDRLACESGLQLVTASGRSGGAEAAVRALALHPRLRWMVFLYLIPPVRRLADAAYRLIARNRHRL